MKCRIISDLHYTKGINGPDYDKTYKKSGLYHYFGKKFKENTDFTLIAGDICEGVENHEKFLEAFFPNQKVIFIDGNHICYENSHPILLEQKKQLKEKFPKEHMFWHYLENDWMWLEYPNIAVIGSTFYTDYTYSDLTLDELNDIIKAWDLWSSLYGLPTKSQPALKLDKKTIRHHSILEASCRMNDFHWGKENMYTRLSPEYYLKLHKLAKREVQRCHDEIFNINKHAKIILLTHHCLSPKCISEKFKKGLLNSSYTSDLENWVDKKLPNVKLVVSGHVHNRNDFTFGKRNVKYICNPCGYIAYNEPFKDVKFNPNLIIDLEEL